MDAKREADWRQRLQRYYLELGLDPNQSVPAASRTPFDAAACELTIELRPEVVSFHFGLPEEKLQRKVMDAGMKIIASATSVDEARWLEDRGCDAIIAQGYEAGGHRGNFLSDDVSTQAGTMALVPQVVDAVKSSGDTRRVVSPMRGASWRLLRWRPRRCRWGRPICFAQRRRSVRRIGRRCGRLKTIRRC